MAAPGLQRTTTADAALRALDGVEAGQHGQQAQQAQHDQHEQQDPDLGPYQRQLGRTEAADFAARWDSGA